MEFDVEELEGLKRKINITIPKDVVSKKVEDAYKILNKKVNIPGFRPGKIPQKILDKQTKPTGKLTINTTVGFGSTWLTPRINKFTDQYPDMEISILMSDEEIDLSSRSADLAVRVKKPTQANLIFKKFVNFHNHIYGSSDYLKKFGIPRNVNDLEHHNFICPT